VKRAGPREFHLAGAECCRRYPVHSASHVDGGSPGEGQQQERLRRTGALSLPHPPAEEGRFFATAMEFSVRDDLADEPF
jgi:hypothetical protein